MPALCNIEGAEIVIRLPIDALPDALAAIPLGVEYRITNASAFAEEMVRALNREEEDGTMPVYELFDAAMESAIEEGGEGWEECPSNSGEEE